MSQSQHGIRSVLRRTRLLSRRTLVTLVLGMALVVPALPMATGHAAASFASGVTAQLDAYLSGLTAQKRFSGVVLAAQHGTILLSKGYGMADAAHKVPNGPAVLYPVGGVGTTIPTWVAALRLEAQGTLHDTASVCAYLSPCPAAWKPITLGMVLAGTSGLGNYDWGNAAGQTIASRLRQCEAMPLAAGGGKTTYTGCAVIAVGRILERVTGHSWATVVGQLVLGPAGMRHTGRITNAVRPAGLARDYSFGVAHVSPEYYDDFYQLYATVGDVYALNTALFGGKLLSAATLQRTLAPRDTVVPPDAGIAGARWAYRWKVGTADGHPLIYLTSGAHGFTIADLWFPKDGVTLVVISNDDQNDVEDIAVHLTARVYSQAIAAPIMSARMVSLARAVLATFAGKGSIGTFPFALTPGALWFPTQSPNGYMGTVTRVDTRTGRVVATIDVSARGIARPEQGEATVVAASGQIWAVDSGAQTLVHIDPAMNKVVATIHLGIPAAGLSIAGDTAWAVSDFDGNGGNMIVRVDLHTLKVVALIKDAGDPYAQVAATPDALWFISEDTEKIGRIDPATDKVVATIRAGLVPVALNVAAGSVWVGDASGALVTRIDTHTNMVVATIKSDGYPGNRQPSRDNCWCRYAVGDGSVWVIANNTTLLRINPQTNRPVASLTFNNDIGSIGVGDGGVWVATDGGNPAYTIYRVDPQAMSAGPRAMSATPAAPRETSTLDGYLSGLDAQSKFSGAVLVARQGAILLSKGYGMADRARHIPNTPDTKYPVGGVSSNMSLIGALWLEDHGKLPDQAPICHYIASCPAAWRPITIHMVLDGTANVPHIDWPNVTGTTAHALQILQTERLDGKPGARFDFQNGDTLVLASIIEKVSGEPWATFLQQTIYGPSGMRRSGRMTDTSTPPGWAQDYSGQTADSHHTYSNFYVVSSTAADIYAFDNALFGGHLLSPRMLTRMFTPLAPTFADNSSYLPGLTDEQTCYQAWTSGRALGHAVLFTSNGARSFQTINMRFPHDQATIVVISNDDHDDVAGIARHLATLLFGKAAVAPHAAHSTVRVVALSRAIVATMKVPGGFTVGAGSGAIWIPLPARGSVARLDPVTNRVVAEVKINDASHAPDGSGVALVGSGNGQVWIADDVHDAVVRIDPTTNRVVARIPVGIRPFSIAIAGHTLWTVSSYEDSYAPTQAIVRVDLRTQKVVATIPATVLGEPFLVLAASQDALWFADWASGTVKRLDAATNKVVAAIQAGPQPSSLALGDGAVWISNHFSNRVTRIDPRTNAAGPSRSRMACCGPPPRRRTAQTTM